MEFPYCTINNKKYKLEWINEILRFPRIKEDCEDLNKLHIDYFNKLITTNELLEEYTTTGCSYYLVEGKFQKFGINSGALNSGDHFEMELFSGIPDIDKQYNYTEEDKIILGIQTELSDFIDNDMFSDYLPKEIITLFENYIEKLKPFI